MFFLDDDNKYFQHKWWWAATMMVPPSQVWNCSLALPLTPALSLICLNQGLATASPSCLGGGLLSVEGQIMPIMSFSLVYIGLLATTAGHIFTTQGAAHLSIQCKPQDCKIAEMVGNPELDGLILRPPFRFIFMLSVSNLYTIAVCQEFITQRGRHPHFLTQLCC